MTWELAGAWSFLLLLLRTSGLFLTAPVLSAKVVPARARLPLAALVAFAAWSAAGSPSAQPPDHLGALAVAAAAETALGALGGLAARFVLQAAVAMGSLVSLSSGMGLGAILDPSSGAESNALGELVHVSAQAGAVALGLHREAIAWLARTALAFPPGAPMPLRDHAAKVIWEATGSVALGARLAFPVMAAVLVGHLAMAALGRTAQQLNLGTIGFSVTVLAGGGAFYLVAPAAAELVARAALAALSRS